MRHDSKVDVIRVGLLVLSIAALAAIGAEFGMHLWSPPAGEAVDPAHRMKLRQKHQAQPAPGWKHGPLIG